VVYSEAFKQKIVQRMLGPDAPSATALSKELKIPQSTLSIWLRRASTLPDVPVDKTPPVPASSRSPQDKLHLVLAFEALPEPERGAWLRRQGLHEADLNAWRQAMVSALGDPKTEATAHATASMQGKRIRQLEREIQRKDKVLAEAAALLVLQKKVRALWADEDDDTPEGSDS
jgi:transposase-like protein